MSKATTTSITGLPASSVGGPSNPRRRAVLTGTAAVAGALAAGAGAPARAAPASPDADLITFCAQLDALEREYLATDFAADYGTPADDAAEAERERIAGAQDPVVDAICASPPCTPAGAVAVARSLALWDAELLKKGGEGHCTDDRLLAALVRGLTGSAAA
jgi:hypothetical protein